MFFFFIWVESQQKQKEKNVFDCSAAKFRRTKNEQFDVERRDRAAVLYNTSGLEFAHFEELFSYSQFILNNISCKSDKII